MTEQKDQRQYYSQLPLIDWVRSLPANMRDKVIVPHTGTSVNYISKRMFTYDYELSPVFKMRIAVGLDKASNGQCDFRDMVEDSEAIDWEYVRQALNHRTRKPRKLNRPEQSEQSE